MKKKKVTESADSILIDWLLYRMRLLDVERQNYEQNSALMQNIKTANVEIIQNDIEDIRGALNKILRISKSRKKVEPIH